VTRDILKKKPMTTAERFTKNKSKQTGTKRDPKDSARGVSASVESDILRELAAATTAYHEASPDGFEAARVSYLEVLQRFRLAQSAEVPRTFTAGSGSGLDVRE
jgi:hypothetical protein